MQRQGPMLVQYTIEGIENLPHKLTKVNKCRICNQRTHVQEEHRSLNLLQVQLTLLIMWKGKITNSMRSLHRTSEIPVVSFYCIQESNFTNNSA
uniref:Uncharacterized protein n=1 Tax=Rhizophora mucronata TaxID=61149 RepID=A0A2P2IUZ7_RHIMU